MQTLQSAHRYQGRAPQAVVIGSMPKGVEVYIANTYTGQAAVIEYGGAIDHVQVMVAKCSPYGETLICTYTGHIPTTASYIRIEVPEGTPIIDVDCDAEIVPINGTLVDDVTVPS